MSHFSKVLCSVLVLAAFGCSSKKETGKSATTKNTLERIKVELASKSESQVTGTVEFQNTEEGVRVVANIKGLKPNAKHGFHIHEKPDCSAADASSAGGHFNPMGHEHGSPSEGYHAGDLGNLETNEQGEATLDMVFAHISLNPAAPSYIVNRSVVVHADEDDLESQPAGNAGPRIACGTISL